MSLTGDERTTIFLIVFAISGINYLFYVYKAYQHSKEKGYNPTFPMGGGERLKFFRECSSNYTKFKDRKLKKYYILLNTWFAIFVVLMLYFIFT